MNVLRSLVCLLAIILTGAAAAGQDLDGKTLVTPSLVADTTKVAAGQPFTVGVRMQIAAGWHVYWQHPGESGGPPKIEWQLPAGFQAGPIQWPIPASHLDAGDLLTYIYEGDLLLPVEITPPAQLPAGDIHLQADLRWLVCEKICVPGKGSVTLTLPAGAGGAPANAERFAAARALLPRTDAAPFRIEWEAKADALTVKLTGLPGEVAAEFFPLPPGGVTVGQPKPGEIAGDGARSITFPITDGGAEGLAWRGVVVTTKAGVREGWEVAAPGKTGPAAVAAPSASGAGGLGWKLLLAFLGGLILNVMPCVLPVIALKIFGFVHQAGQEPARIFRLGLAFTAGVFTFFLVLATVVVQLKTAFNWGYVLQNPYSLSALVALIFVFSLNLLGVFEIALGSGAASKLDEISRQEGYGGAFFHGLFTTLLGTSCTAPFLAASLGFATTQPAPIIFLVFLTIAAGMALPYFLLTARPAWLRLMPKPGAWMERVKNGMGFVMLAVAVWLFGVLALRGADVAGGMAWLLLALGIGCWIVRTWSESWVAIFVQVALAGLGYYLFLQEPLAAAMHATPGAREHRSGKIIWEPYSDERLAAARQAGQPVFIDFTAEWCINCKVYERVLATDKVGAKFAEQKVVPLRADWTNTNEPVVTRALKSYGRVGVPLYVLYRPGEENPVLLDALTPGGLLGELARIKK